MQGLSQWSYQGSEASDPKWQSYKPGGTGTVSVVFMKAVELLIGSDKAATFVPPHSVSLRVEVMFGSDGDGAALMKFFFLSLPTAALQ